MKLRNVFKRTGVVSSSDVDIVASEQKTKELYEEAAANGKAPGKTCKIQILGDERVGKTSLRKRLMGEKFDPEEPSTFGVDTRFCKVNEIDETWRERQEETGSEYDRVISWVLANALRKWDESAEENVTKESKLSFVTRHLIKGITSSLSLFAMSSVLLLYFTVSSFMTSLTFCNILIFISSLSVIATNTSDIYRIGVGLAILVPLVEVLIENIFENIKSCETDAASSEQFLVSSSLLILWSVSGIIYGIICGFGFRTGVAAGVLTLTIPNRIAQNRLEHTLYNYIDILKVLLALGCGLNFTVLCSSSIPRILEKISSKIIVIDKRLNKFPISTIPALLFPMFLCMKYVKHVSPFSPWLNGFLLGVGIMSGLYFGRWMAERMSNKNGYEREKTFAGFIIGIFAGYICGYRIPILRDDSLSTVDALSRLVPLAAAEIFKRISRKNNPAPVHLVSDKLANSENTLPVKLSIWDFAGQEFYYNTHHTFMAPDAVYIIVFDLFKFQQESLRTKELDRIKFWMNSVHQHSYSSMFLVGTHFDCVDRDDLEHITQYLDDYLFSGNNVFLQKLVLNKNFPFFAIDNSASVNKSGIPDDTTILREAIRRETDKAKVMKQEYPIRWRHFLDLVHLKYNTFSSSACKEPFISIMDLKTTLTNFGFSEVNEIKDMLEFFHDSGEIIYDSVDSILRQFVILRPQFILDVMESIVYIPESKVLGRLTKSASRLKNTGVLEYDLAKFLVTNKVLIGDTEQLHLPLVLSMLEAKDLLCKVYHSDQSSGVHGCSKLVYVVPSMLPKGQPIPSVSVEWDVQYYLDFRLLLPDALLFRLLARCSSHSNLLCQGTDQCLLFREGGLFNLGTQFFFMLRKLQPCADQDIIEVSVKGTPESNPIDVLRYVHNIMETLRCRDFPRLRYHAGIRCPHPGPHQDCTSDRWHIVHLCGSGETLFPEERKVHRLCNGRLVDFDLDASIPVDCRQSDEMPMIVNVMGNNNYVVIAGRNARIAIHRELISNSDTRTGNSYNVEDLSDIDVFISCSNRDEGWVQENIIRLLVSPPHQLTVCTNQYDTKSHPNHVKNMKEIEASRVFLIVCSKNYRQDPTGRLRYEREVARIIKIPVVAVDIDGANRLDDIFDTTVISFSDSDENGMDSLLSDIAECLDKSYVC